MNAVAIGDGRRLAGYALAGAAVHDAATDAEALAAFDALDAGALLVLTAQAQRALAARLAGRDDLAWVVLPE